MALHFALRSRLRLRDEPVAAPPQRLPAYAVPVASYWAIMGLLTYGVASGALRPERLAALRLPQGDFAAAPVTPVAAPEPTSTSSEPLAVAVPALPAQAVEAPSPRDLAPEQPPRRTAAVRPLAGFSLGGGSPDGDDGYRDPSPGVVASVDGDEEPRATHARPKEENATVAMHARRTERDATVATREPDTSLLLPREFQPARRGAIALHAPKRTPVNESRPLRANADDPYPGFRDDLDEHPAPPRPVAPEDRPAPRERERVRPPPPAAASVSSCEAVVATANDVMDLTAARGTPDITRGAYASLLERGGYLMPCGVPESMALEVCAAVRDGRAVGITVVTRPADARVRACVRNAVAALPFPKSPRLDVTRTRFEARGR
jgi:hypothetical protein